MLVSKKLTFLGAAIVAATSLVAQENTGTLLGTVREPGNRPSARATLVIAGDAILGSRTLTTDENGHFRISLLPAGNYTLTVSKQGFIGSKATMRISGGQIVRQDLTLREVSAASAEVEIVGASAAVDKSETKTSTNFSATQLAELPLGLTSYAAIAMAPGTTGSQLYPVIRGGLTGEAAVMVDGISIKDPSVRQVRNFEYVMGDMTEDIAVIQSPLNAKYGNSAGGAIAITSKSGKNHFEGTFRVDPDIEAWNTLRSGYNTRLGNSIIADPGEVPSDYMGKEYVISIFGPIIPDHLTFSYSGNFIPSEYVVLSASNLSTTQYTRLPNFPGYTGSRDGHLYGATPGNPLRAGGNRDSITQQYKLFWMINQNHQIEGLYSKNDFGPYFQGFGTYDSLAYQSSIRELTSINYRGIIGNNGILEAKWGRRRNEIEFANGPGDSITVRVWNGDDTVTSLLSTTGTATMSHNGVHGQDKVLRNSESLGANYNWFNGTHNIDVGFEQLKDIVNEPPGVGPNGRRFYAPARRYDGLYAVYNYVGSEAQTGSDPYYRNNTAFIPEMVKYNYEKGGTIPEYTTNSFYANDLWTIDSNLSVMFGLRWDSWMASGVNGKYIDSSGISPRFEIKYDLSGDNQHLFTASYAHFRGTISSGAMGGVFEQKPGQQSTRYFWDKGTGTPENPQWVTMDELLNESNYGLEYSVADNSVLYGVDPSLQPTTTIEYTVSYRRAFAN
ncbi:MAG: TonB-dependent receptor, partial [Holophagales bacterium]|nr:TonB-dependent receptor [Holophagales bacterium]